MKLKICTCGKGIAVLLNLFITAITLSACGGGGGGGPTTPGVSSVNPSKNATNVDKSTVVTATFRDGMDEVDLAANIQAEFTLGDSSGNSISGVASYDDVLNLATLNPDVNLGILKTYTATLGAGGTITHSGGTVMPQYSWSFKTLEGAWGTEENIEIDGSSDFSNPYVAVAGNGDAMAIWMSISGSTWIVHYNKYSSSTGIWGNMQTLTSSTNNAISDLRVAMDESGNALAVWSQDPANPSIDLYASFYDGALWSGATLVEGIGGTVSNPQVAFDGSGNAIVVWLHDGSIYSNRYTGSWNAGAAQDIDAGAEAAKKPQLAVFDNGDAIAVWGQYDPGLMYDVIYVNHYDVVGDVWSGATPLGNSATGAIPQIAVSDSGDAIVVWLQGSGPYSAYAAAYDGASWGSPVELDNDAHINTIAQVGVDAQGNGIALWRAAPLVPGPSVDRLEYKLFDGTSWSAVGNIDNGVSDSLEPKLVMDDEGHAIVVWKQYNNNTDMVYSTWSNRYRSDTNSWGTPKLLETVDYSDAPTNMVPAPISFAGLGMNKNNGNAFAIWLQDQDGFAINSVWVNHFTN